MGSTGLRHFSHSPGIWPAPSSRETSDRAFRPAHTPPWNGAKWHVSCSRAFCGTGVVVTRRRSGKGAALVSAVLLSTVTASAQDIATGVRVYEEERCALCHSIGDDGNKRGPLDGVGSRLSAEDIERWMLVPDEMTEETGAKRRPYMPAYPDLSAEELEALVAYMLSLKEP